MPRPTQWRDLKVGLAALAAVTVIGVGILYFGRLGRLRGDTYHVFVRTPEARGIIRGSEVWLAGQKIGAVRGIAFIPPSAGDANRVVVDVELMVRHRAALRRDSPVAIRTSGTFIGSPVIYLGIGSPESPIVREGDTLQASVSPGLGSMAERAGGAIDEIPAVMENLEAITDLARSPDGTLGALRQDRGGAAYRSTRARMAAISSRLRSDSGSAALLLGRRDELLTRARVAMSGADSLRQLLRSDRTSLGRFRRDSTLVRSVADLRNEVSIVRAMLADTTGTLGRLRSDSAIVVGLARIEDELAALIADVKRNPVRYLPF